MSLALNSQNNRIGSHELRCDPMESYLPSSDAIHSLRWLTKLNLQQPRRGIQCIHPTVRTWKRVVDVVGAISLMILTAPLMLLAAFLVRITSRGPVIYRQTRVGLNARDRNDRRRSPTAAPPNGVDRRAEGRDRRAASAYGRHFVLYKFRTMTVDAEKSGAQFAKRGDTRVTWVGRIFRKTRIDELPQLWNVLKGEMSLVGPRPERPEFIADLTKEIPNYVNRLGLKPGLTGLAQVVNGYDNEIEGFRRKVTYDLAYLQHCCLRNDLKILLRTVRVVVTGQGAI